MRSGRSTLGLLVALLVVGVVWWTQGDGTTEPERAGDSTSSVQAPAQQDDAAAEDPPAGETIDPASGLPWIAQERLPAEADDTLELIDAGGPYPYEEDDGVFGNREGILPDEERGYYREYTVETPGLSHRGARRIVTGADGEYYWTADHYSSFSRIDREGG